MLKLSVVNVLNAFCTTIAKLISARLTVSMELPHNLTKTHLFQTIFIVWLVGWMLCFQQSQYKWSTKTFKSQA